MGDKTGIEWTDHTYNPWWGCTKVSPGCDSCYAETWAKRYGTTWGFGAPRRFFGDKHWDEPRKWNRKAEKAHVRHRVFCASMSDVFDNEVMQSHRDRLWQLIKETPYLDWQLLTKRIGNVEKMLPQDWGTGYPNGWLGISIVNQEEADRDIPKLLQTPAVVRFLSVEPLLAPVTLNPLWLGGRKRAYGKGGDIYGEKVKTLSGTIHTEERTKINWCIIGGESGPGARPMYLDWARSLVHQCKAAGVACFYKQGGNSNSCIHDRKGGHFECFPKDLQIREFPNALQRSSKS